MPDDKPTPKKQAAPKRAIKFAGLEVTPDGLERGDLARVSYQDAQGRVRKVWLAKPTLLF